MEDSAGDRVKRAALFLQSCTTNGRFDEKALGRARDIKTEPGFCSCVIPVTLDVENRFGTLHGGCIATIVDVTTSAALLTVSPEGGVSVDLNCSYLSAAPSGEDVLVEARVLKVGSSIACITCDIKNARTGKLLAQGRHTKFVPGSSRLMAKKSKL